jgi:hypothetical protein
MENWEARSIERRLARLEKQAREAEINDIERIHLKATTVIWIVTAIFVGVEIAAAIKG